MRYDEYPDYMQYINDIYTIAFLNILFLYPNNRFVLLQI